MKLSVVQILRHLPKPNCKECGEPTCMVFAARLMKNEKQLQDCKPLLSGQHTEKCRLFGHYTRGSRRVGTNHLMFRISSSFFEEMWNDPANIDQNISSSITSIPPFIA